VLRVVVKRALGPLAVVFAFAFPGVAEAGTPVLTAVGHQDGHLTATWTLPPQTEVWGIRVSTSPRTASSGDFFEEDVVLSDLFSGNQRMTTSYLSGEKLKPGFYFVKVYGYDNICFYVPFDDPRQCGVVYSNALALTVSATPRYRLTLRKVQRTVFVNFSNLNATVYDPLQHFRICWTRRRLPPACTKDAVMLGHNFAQVRISARLTNPLRVTAYVDGAAVAKKSLRIR
jgi:hypothetical protein